MSTVTSCTLLSSVTALRPAISSGRQVQSGRPAAVASLSSQWRSRPLSVCCAVSPKGDHNPKTDLHPFNIPAFVLVHPVSPREERWQVEEEPSKVNLWFEVPGLSSEDLAVLIDEDVLVIKKKVINVTGVDAGQRNTVGSGAGATDYRPQPNTRRGGEATGKEAAQKGEVIYARMLLPAGYSREGVQAELKSGVLRVSIDKVKTEARRIINVHIDI
ncbi:hypothetical protein HU200_065966 [Digitaria exilis]|uniref:SHSP domain-containing protein n=1 Tax=Digitaria exilis TaxID=1010633 RepID=A0A835A1V5_9POAL|nr:hypothetical protein HU200_065966 [Digitaria exilis]